MIAKADHQENVNRQKAAPSALQVGWLALTFDPPASSSVWLQKPARLAQTARGQAKRPSYRNSSRRREPSVVGSLQM